MAPPSSAGSHNVAAAIIFYCFCSASMLVVNKVAIVYFPFPTTLLAIQFVASAIVPKVLGMAGVLECDRLETKKVLPFLKAVAVFFGTLFTSMKALQVLNVDTVTVFRSSLPLAVAVGDYLFLQRQTWVSLCMTLAGSIAFIFKETRSNSFTAAAAWGHYFWGIMYWLFMVADQLVLKHIVDGGPKLSTWGRVYYQNTLSLVPAMILSVALGEIGSLRNPPKMGPGSFVVDVPMLAAVGASCVVGCGISFSGFLLRKYVSALSFTVIGVVNKLASVAINTLIWDKHAGYEGLAALVVCVFGATLYRQPDKKGEEGPPSASSASQPSAVLTFFKSFIMGTGGVGDVPPGYLPALPTVARRATVFQNGGGAGIGRGGHCLHIKDKWEDFVNDCAHRLQIKAPTHTLRVFNVNGGEVNDLSLLRDDEVLFVSAGEPFRTPGSASHASLLA